MHTTVQTSVSQSTEPGDRNDEPRRPGTYFNYEVFESHIGNPALPFFAVNPNSRWISASEQRICFALADFFLDVEPLRVRLALPRATGSHLA